MTGCEVALSVTFEKVYSKVAKKEIMNQKLKILSKVAGLSSKVVHFLVILRILARRNTIIVTRLHLLSLSARGRRRCIVTEVKIFPRFAVFVLVLAVADHHDRTSTGCHLGIWARPSITVRGRLE